MAEKILVVEDDPTLQETLAYNLERQVYDVFTAGDGQIALELADRGCKYRRPGNQNHLFDTESPVNMPQAF